MTQLTLITGLNILKRKAASNGAANKLAPEDNAAHGWYRFVLSYPPHLVRKYLDEFELTRRHTVLDPFCGTGTTLVECRKHAIKSVGIEPNQMAFFASSVKVDWALDPDRLLAHSKRIADTVYEVFETEGIEDVGEDGGGVPCRLSNSLLSLSPEAAKLILADSISPLPLHKTLTLLQYMKAMRNNKYDRHQRLALANAIVNRISNLHFGPEVGVGRAKSNAPVIPSWLNAIESMVADLEVLKRVPTARVDLFCADSRNLVKVLKGRKLDAVITSPPYPNEKDYTRTTRLESVLLGFLKNKTQLREMKERLLRSNTRNVFKADLDDLFVKDHREIQRIAAAIEQRRLDLGKTSGFERLYSRVTKLYFGGMYRHLSELRQFLRPGARLAYVVGDQASYLRIMIRTGKLLAEIAESLGYVVDRIDLFRTRLATATRAQLREEVVLLRWPGKTRS